MINANTIHILVLYTISYGSLIILKIHFHIQYFTISNQFNYAHKFNSVLQFNSVMKINYIKSIQLCQSIQLCKSIISNQFNYANQFSYVIQFSYALNEFNLCLRYTGYQSHRHDPAGLQAGITRFYNTVRSRWAAD